MQNVSVLKEIPNLLFILPFIAIFGYILYKWSVRRLAKKLLKKSCKTNHAPQL